VSAAQTSFRAVLKRLDLDKTVAMHAQRIGTLPEPKLEKVLAQYRGTEDFITLNELMIHARPHWYQEKRRDNHERIIRQAAKASLTSVRLGPFGLTYMDAPWRFEVFARDTAQGLPDDHYPTLTDEEIINIRFHGQTIDELAQDDCAMFMWCTSSNLQRALKVMKRLGFDYTPPGATVWRAIPALSYEAVKVALRSFGEGGRDPAPHPKRFGNHVAIAGNAMMISRRTILIAM